MILIRAAAAALTISSVAFTQTLWRVDDTPGTGADFADIQDAIVAAADGDTILVENGSYGEIEIVGKSLTVIGREAGQVVLSFGSSGRIEIRDLNAAQRVVLRNLSLSNNVEDFQLGTRIESCDGPVWIEDLAYHNEFIFPPDETPSFGNSDPLLDIEDCASVTVIRSSMANGHDIGLHSVDSTVHLFETTISDGLSSGRGAVIEGGFLFASGSTIKGDNGSPTIEGSPNCFPGPFGELICFPSCAGPGSPGHTAMYLEAGNTGAPAVLLLDTNLIPGVQLVCPGDAPVFAPESIVTSGAIGEFAVPMRSLAVDAPLAVGETAQFASQGVAGDVVFFMLGTDIRPAFHFACHGPLMPTFQFLSFAGISDSEGLLAVDSAIGGLGGPTKEVLTLYIQGLHVSTGGLCHYSSPTALVLTR